MSESQLMKGILEGCVLAVIARKETYGYDILNQLESYGFDNIMEGTLYPLLTRLRKKGLIKGTSVKSPYGPVRKIYGITEDGARVLNEFQDSYKKVTKVADSILFEGESEHESEVEL